MIKEPYAVCSISGTAPKRCPVQVAAERDDLSGRRTGVFGVATVEGTTHPAHHGGHLLTHVELPARTNRHCASCLYPQDTWKRDTRGQTKAGVELGPVQAKSPDLDQHLARTWRRDPHLTDLQRLRRTWRIEHNRLHDRHA